jgi:MFS family permease
LLLTGLSTFAVGFVPGYAEIGIWGAVILTVLRLIQGIGVGGELGGAVCRSAPSPQPSPRKRAGLSGEAGR